MAPVGEWHHAAAVFQPTAAALVNGTLDGTLRLYLDGQLLHTQPETLNAFRDVNHSPLYIGRSNTSNESFRGELFETRIALAALAPTQFLLPVAAPTNRPPAADAGGPYAGTYGGPVTLTGSGSDPDGDSLTYAWTVNGVALPAGPTASRTLSWADLRAAGVTGAGTYPVRLTVDDGRGGITTSAEASLVVGKAAPVVAVVGGSFTYDGQAHPVTGSVTGVLGEDLGTPDRQLQLHRQQRDGGDVGGRPGRARVLHGDGVVRRGRQLRPRLGRGTDPIAFEVRTLTDLSKAFNAGRTIPIKVQLRTRPATNVSSAGISVTALAAGPGKRRRDREPRWPSRTPGSANPEGLFRYDAALGGYIFNLSTKGLGAGTYEFSWSAEGDPTEHTLGFRLV